MSVQNAKTIIDILSGGNLSNARIRQVALDFIFIDENTPNTGNMTNDEIAQEFLSTLRKVVKNKVANTNRIRYRQNAGKVAEDQAATDSTGDL